MLVHKCDACGKVIETNESRYIISIGSVNRRYNKVTDGMERDLCGKCYDKIIYILKGVDECPVCGKEQAYENGDSECWECQGNIGG